jgi:hypothetical protein
MVGRSATFVGVTAAVRAMNPPWMFDIAGLAHVSVEALSSLPSA